MFYYTVRVKIYLKKIKIKISVISRAEISIINKKNDFNVNLYNIVYDGRTRIYYYKLIIITINDETWMTLTKKMQKNPIPANYANG